MNNEPIVQVIEPGLVLIRNHLSDEACQDFARMACSWGQEGEDGFYTVKEDGRKTLNTDSPGRGRIYDKATRFPKTVTSECARAVSLARANDSKMPDMDCTHLLLNMYTTSEGLVWHRDIYENDGKSDHPVVNLCVGASCRFGLKDKDTDPVREVVLRNGDCLLFGGPCRLIKHAVLEVLLNDCPHWMADNPVRFSFTFRDSPEVLGREDEFKYFKVSEHLVGQDDFDDPNCDPDARRPSLPSQMSSRSFRSSETSLPSLSSLSVRSSTSSTRVLTEEIAPSIMT